LKNEGGKFVDVTDRYCPELRRIGMVTDALWTDFDNDGKVDLMVVGEWMPVTFFRNTGHSFKKVKSGIESHTGWWNSIVAGDFDNDGDMDYVVGNLGLNSNYYGTPEKPLTIVAKDIDNNGTTDPMVFSYMKDTAGIFHQYPIVSRNDLINQVTTMRGLFPTYKSYGYATLQDIWSEGDLSDALVLKAIDMNSSYIENTGKGSFTIKPLPIEAQAAPLYGMLAKDINNDGNLDVMMIGNDYSMDPYSGRHDAFNGLCLKGDGKGNFSGMRLTTDGFFVKGDGKGLASVHTAKNEDIIIATQNQDSLEVLSKNPAYRNTLQFIKLNPDDWSGEIVFKNGKKRYIEFYYGSTYLSQSSRILPVEKNYKKITITGFNGIQRTVFQTE
jgi:hypothetical protein